jgi:hypothetical protein
MINCPNCNSKSGVDVHNRLFCHACHLDFPGNRKNLVTIENSKVPLQLPKRNDESLPIKCVEWLDKYEVYNDSNNFLIDIFYSKEYKRLCFPLYNEYDNIVACWMRDFDTNLYPYNMKKVKWLFVGDKSELWLLKPKYKLGHSLVLVEDIISALKIQQINDVICLGGTSLPNEVFTILNNYKEIILFLDGDMAGLKAAQKIRNQLKLFIPVKIIYAKKDPKDHTYEELEDLLIQ